MSGARRRSKSLWDNNKEEETIPQVNNTSPKRSNLEANDVFMSDDFPHDLIQPNENIPHRGGNRDRDRSRSPHRNRDRDRNRNRDERRESYESGDIRNDSISRTSSHRQSKDFASRSSSGFRDDRNKDSDSYRNKDSDYHRGSSNNNNNNNNSRNNAYDNNSTKPPCRFFLMGNCNRNNCKYSHDVPKKDGYQERSHDNKHDRNHDDMNKSWNDFGNQEFHQQIQDFPQNPVTSNGDEKIHDINGGNLLEASRNGIPSENIESKEEVPQVNDKQILANALELLYSLPNSGSTNPPVNVPVGVLSDSGEHRNQIPTESVIPIPVESVIPTESVGVKEEKEEKKKKDESSKNTKVEEGDEKAMRQFKIVLVEFVKEILKPTWKEGKMSREVYKTIVKKVVEKVSSSIQGVQIPKTQEKIDQYLAFSKSKITKLVEAYVGRHQKA